MDGLEFREVASGYCFLEAPRADGEQVWFVDLLLGGLHRLGPGGKVDTFLADHKHIGGVALNEDGAVICGGQSGLIWFRPETGKSGVLLDTVEGERLTGANDIYSDREGGLYFGTLSRAGDYGGPPSLTSLCHLDRQGRARKLMDGLKFSNGIGLSPDGRRLYHNESLNAVFVYDVQADGGLANKTQFSPQEDGDGLAVDAEGCVWVAGFASGQLVRYRPDGAVDRRMSPPHKVVTSLCFGGADGRDLYVTTGGNEGVEKMLAGELPPREAGLFHARVETPGLPTPRTRFRLPAA
jgi:sugar lactone lactonase YvrE